MVAPPSSLSELLSSWRYNCPVEGRKNGSVDPDPSPLILPAVAVEVTAQWREEQVYRGAVAAQHFPPPYCTRPLLNSQQAGTGSPHPTCSRCWKSQQECGNNGSHTGVASLSTPAPSLQCTRNLQQGGGRGAQRLAAAGELPSRAVHPPHSPCPPQH